jgi:hypothetical protein
MGWDVAWKPSSISQKRGWQSRSSEEKLSTQSLVEGSIFFPAVDEEQEAWKVI